MQPSGRPRAVFSNPRSPCPPRTACPVARTLRSSNSGTQYYDRHQPCLVGSNVPSRPPFAPVVPSPARSHARPGRSSCIGVDDALHWPRVHSSTRTSDPNRRRRRLAHRSAVVRQAPGQTAAHRSASKRSCTSDGLRVFLCASTAADPRVSKSRARSCEARASRTTYWSRRGSRRRRTRADVPIGRG